MSTIALAADGTLSADDQPLAQIGLFRPIDAARLTRAEGARFAAQGGVEPAFDARLVQGFVEESNVDPVAQIARMIEVQRAYELGQTFLDREDRRIRDTVEALTR
jgi:flagellar basal-body rod protein FlgF